MPRLLLFDIDGTLLDSGGAGAMALLDAVEEVFGESRDKVPTLDLAGATDGAITRQILTHLGREWRPEVVVRYHESYLKHLQGRLGASSFSGVLMPGVECLLEQLAGAENCYLGLLTGNLRAGARHKLERFNIWGHFADGAFGDDGEDRNSLGPIAKRRMERAAGVGFDSDDILVIGDTPRDIACARAMGARCLAVATGSFSRDHLLVHQPWRVVNSLETDDVEGFLNW